MLEMFVTRFVDAFEKYLVNLIREAPTKVPTMLRSPEPTLNMEQVLQCGSIEELVRDVVETKVGKLSYEGFADLQEWCGRKGIPLVVPHGKDGNLIELACQWLERGGNLAALQQVLGHASIETTQRYARLSDEVVMREAERIGSQC